MAGKRKAEKGNPVCIEAPCVMTMGYYIGAGRYICWLHALTVPGMAIVATDALRATGLQPIPRKPAAARKKAVKRG